MPVSLTIRVLRILISVPTERLNRSSARSHSDLLNVLIILLGPKIFLLKAKGSTFQCHVPCLHVFGSMNSIHASVAHVNLIIKTNMSKCLFIISVPQDNHISCLFKGKHCQILLIFAESPYQVKSQSSEQLWRICLHFFQLKKDLIHVFQKIEHFKDKEQITTKKTFLPEDDSSCHAVHDLTFLLRYTAIAVQYKIQLHVS